MDLLLNLIFLLHTLLQIIEVQIQNWIEERNTQERESRRTEARLKKVQAEIDATEKQRIKERAKVSDVKENSRGGVDS